MELIIPDVLVNTMSGCIKSLERDGDIVTVGSHGILYGNARLTDIVGDWFTPKTYLGAHHGLGVDTMIHHGMPLSPELKSYCDVLLNPTTYAEPDDEGLLVKTILNLSKQYRHQWPIYECVEKKSLSWSGGALNHGVRRKDGVKNGEITQWILGEFSFTPTPCENRMVGIMPMKAWLDNTEYLESDSFRATVKALTTVPPMQVNVPLDLSETASGDDKPDDNKPDNKSVDLSTFNPSTTDDVTGAIESILRARMTVDMQSAGVRAALKVFLSRMDDLATERSSSRKSGAVLSGANHQRLSKLRDTAAQMRDSCASMHDDLHDMVETYRPANMQDKDDAKSVDLVAIEKSRNALRVEMAKARLRLVA